MRIVFQNGIGFGGPFEGLRLCVALSYLSLDRGFEISDALLNTPRRMRWRVISANSRSGSFTTDSGRAENRSMSAVLRLRRPTQRTQLVEKGQNRTVSAVAARFSMCVAGLAVVP
jgi:hypothetical protein